MDCEECGAHVWRAGNIVPAGTYVRIDDRSYKLVVLAANGPLPATFDGHVARYRIAGVTCACMERACATPASEDAPRVQAPQHV